MQKQRQKQIIKTTAIKSKCKKSRRTVVIFLCAFNIYLPKIRLLVMSKSFYNNASVKCKKSVDSAMTIKKQYSSKRGEKYQYAEQSCINDKRKKAVPPGY